MTTKAVVTLCIDNGDGRYAPDGPLPSLTLPWIRKHAEKIGAEFICITERKFDPSYVVNYEKFQIFDIAQQFDHTLFVDSDALITPEAPDMTELAGDLATVFWATDNPSSMRFKPNIYTIRDQRWAGAGTWIVGCTRYTYDLWTPPEDYNAAVANITSMPFEKYFDKEHLIDDFQLTTNLARFGLQIWRISEYLQKVGRKNSWLWHSHLLSYDEKVAKIKEILKA